MSEAPWQPPEDQIADLLERFSPRQLAIGYLRARRKARERDLAARTMADTADAIDAAHSGDWDRLTDDLERATRRLRNAGAHE